MVKRRTLLKVTIRITPKEGRGQRLIRAELIRLPHDSPEDRARRIEKFEVRIEDRGRVKAYLRYSDSVREVKDGLRSRLQGLLEAVNHNTYVIEVRRGHGWSLGGTRRAVPILLQGDHTRSRADA